MEYLKKNKTIIVRSSPENSYYKKMKAILDTNTAVSQGIKDRNLEIVEDSSAKSGEFNLYLYGQDGSLHYSDNNFGDDTFSKVFSFVDGMTVRPSQSGGSKSGNVNYREKYFKYKHKYEDMRDVITSFNPNNRI